MGQHHLHKFKAFALAEPHTQKETRLSVFGVYFWFWDTALPRNLTGPDAYRTPCTVSRCHAFHFAGLDRRPNVHIWK